MDAEPRRRATPAAQPRRQARGRRWAQAKKVLVVNDHVKVRSVITEFLRRRGFIAIPVRDADSARVICERIAPDLVLLHLVDLDIPESSLIRLLKRLHPTTPIVVVSAGVDPEMERECRVLGSDEVLQKPIVLAQLDRTITRLLRPGGSPAR
jgi:two-component system phosphate regulon response regulator OmpR